MSKMITVKRAAEILDVTPHYIRKLIKEERIQGNQLSNSNRWQVDSESLEAFKKTDIFKVDLAQLQKPQAITMKEMVENIEEVFDADVINYISNPSPVSQIDYNDPIALDDLLNTLSPRRRGKNKKFNKVVLVLHSPGGILEAAIKIVRIIESYSDKFEVIVPLSAKSAATLIALSADKLYMTSLSELGPVDPIVQSPTNPAIQVPAKAIKDFIDTYGKDINSTDQNSGYQILLRKMENSLDPYLLGSYQGALNFAQTEIKKVLETKINDQDKLQLAIGLFFNPDQSHAYPIMYNELKNFGLSELLNKNIELQAVKMLMSGYTNFMVTHGIVKLIGNRDENKNLAIQQVVQQKLVTTENRV